MAAAVLMEEELQNSMATSEEDAEFEEEDELAAEINADAYAANDQLHNGMAEQQSAGDEDEEDEEDGGDEDNLTDEDAEGEEDDEMIDGDENNEDDELDEDEDDEDVEGVGAVKIQPGLSDDDEERSDEDESVPSGDDDDASKDSTDVEVEAEWEAVAEGDEEEDDEAANPNRCIFCLQDEENDPSEIFELYLACGICGDNAHQQCARDANALKPDDDPEIWYCMECVGNKLAPGVAAAHPDARGQPTRRISRDRVPGDLLPSQRSTRPDSHSVFNQLIAPDDPMDGSRLLRKRKTSSVEAEAADATSLRRRNRDKDSSSQSNARPSHDHAAEAADKMEVDELEETALTNGNEKMAEAPTSPRTSRSLRPKSLSSSHTPATILEKVKNTTLKVVFRVDPVELRHLLSKPPKPKKEKRRGTSVALSSVVPSYVPSYSQPFYSLHEKETDELKSKPYGGILTEAEADTKETLPEPKHRQAFDRARQQAEEEWNARTQAAAEAAVAAGVKKARKVSGPASQIEYIEFGPYQIDIWYAAPYPEEYSRNKALFICEFCLKYMESDIVAWRHKTKCPWKHPPGDEIYRDGNIMIFEVDGRKNPLYCQNLCLLAKLFLGSKTLYYDVEPFLFYVMTEYDDLGCHFVGYFSKEKRPSSLNNVSCILVLPIHQRKGYGHLLIDFSYLLTRVEKKTGSPEKPLSDMGLVSYRNYWRLVMCYFLQDFTSNEELPSIRMMSDQLGLTPDDVVSALENIGALIRDPVTGIYALKLRTEYYRQVIQQHEAKGYAKLNPKGLVWTPYIMGRGNASAFDHAPPLNTVAPREEDEDSPDSGRSSNTNKRDFETMNGTANGDTADTGDITKELGKLTTKPDHAIKAEDVDELAGDVEESPETNGMPRKLDYYEAAACVPPTRFELFPATPGSRSRIVARPSVSRPAPTQRPSFSTTSSRPKPRRSTGSSSRRSATTSRRSSTTRRRSGGTGRGPGRWPKGTKKSDFGNADSGPGLPPKLLNQRSRLYNEVMLGDEEEDDDQDENEEEVKSESAEQEEEPAEDAILYETPGMRKRSDRGKPQLPLGLAGKTIIAQGQGKTEWIEEGEDEEMEDIAVNDDSDVDAEGEDE